MPEEPEPDAPLSEGLWFLDGPDGALVMGRLKNGRRFARRVSPPLVRESGIAPGVAAEIETQRAAAMWGLPDFVFPGKQLRDGSRVRELGDELIWLGDIGGSIQNKAREQSRDDEAERRWLDKHIRKAGRQARGSVRTLCLANGARELKNSRGNLVEVDGRDTKWVFVVIIDHVSLPDYLPSPGRDEVVLLRRDWDFLFEQLRSTRAVLEYLLRVASEVPVNLGHEPVRFFELALLDSEATRNDWRESYDSAEIGTLRHVTFPALPIAPQGHEDRAGSLAIRTVMEMIALLDPAEGVSSAEMLRTLAGIDSVEVATRERLGRSLLNFLELMAAPSEFGVRFRSRLILGHQGKPALLFAASNEYHPTHTQSYFSNFVCLRHQQLRESYGATAQTSTIGILLTPTARSWRPFDVTICSVRNDVVYEPKDRSALENFFGTLPPDIDD